MISMADTLETLNNVALLLLALCICLLCLLAVFARRYTRRARARAVLAIIFGTDAQQAALAESQTTTDAGS